MSFEHVTTERRGSVSLVGLNRPEKFNAASVTLLEELSAAYGELADDPSLRVGVLHTHGDHFCAGLDLAELWPALLERGPKCWPASLRPEKGRDGGASWNG